MTLFRINSVEDATTLAIASFAVTCGSSHDAARKVKRRKASLSKERESTTNSTHDEPSMNPKFHLSCSNYVRSSLLLCALLGAHCAGIEWKLGPKLSKFNMAGETVELSQLPIPHLENLRSQLEEASIAPTRRT